MERAKKERKAVRGMITKIINEVEGEMAKEEINKAMVRSKYQRLNQLEQDIQRLDRGVLDGLLDEDADENLMEEEQNQAGDYLQKILFIRDKVDAYLEESHAEQARSHYDTASVVSAATATGKARKYKLPKIEFKIFSGELKEYIGWWSQFKTFHEDESLDPTDKFQYLHQSIMENSKARDVVESMPESVENYPKVIAKLQERFGKPKLLKWYYIRELQKLVSTSTKGMEAVSTLYHTLDSHINALASIGVTTTRAAEYLYPMVESCLPEELLIVWQRHPTYLKDGTQEQPPMTELCYLLDFLRIEVENQDQRKLTKGESSSLKSQKQNRKGGKESSSDSVSTSAGLFEGKGKGCLFCTKSNHQSHECLKALNMTLEEKRNKVREGKGCYACFNPRPKSQGFKKCKAPVRCSICSKKHHHFMCDQLAALKAAQTKLDEEVPEATQATTEITAVNSGVQCGGEVLLKTVLVRIVGKNGVKLLARLLFDEGSQSSYITTYAARKIDSEPVGAERVRTIMIDGKLSGEALFPMHIVILQNQTGSRRVKLLLKARPVIGGIPPYAQLKRYNQELRSHGIEIGDHASNGNQRHDIDILIGQDVGEQLKTGKRVVLKGGTYAVESIFGWMLCGPVTKTETSASEVVIQSYFTGDITQLWTLDILGIRDSAEKSAVADNDKRVKEEFQKEVKRQPDGRYVVKLPWLNEGAKAQLPTNQTVCVKRLEAATGKLEKQGKFNIYDAIFKGWEKEGIIESVPLSDTTGHYLPHRPVFKESLTTPVRPVFDASCHMAKRPSLNQCLQKGPNWLELVPSILVRFREKKIGVTSDIRKAFQMISVDERDRKFQKFYW